MAPIGCPETSVRNCHCSMSNDPEERGSQLRGGSLKSHRFCLDVYGDWKMYGPELFCCID